MLKRVLVIYILFISFFANAQTPAFYAQVSKNRVAIGEQFQIAFTLNGPGNNLVYSNLKDFNIHMGPMQSQSMSITNGNMTQSTTISFIISAKKEGKVTIGPASVMANGNQKLETAPIVIEVTKGASAQSGQGGQPDNNEYSDGVSNEDLFVRTYLSKTKCYLGEQITVTQKVYSRVDLRGFQNIKFPPYNGFWSQKEEENKQINLQQEVLNGVSYYVAEYNKVYLFPQRSGSITIEPVELECIVRRATQRQPRSIIEQFFGGGGGYEDIAVKVKSKPVKVEVKELPEANKPEGFTGAVGNFSYKAEINKEQVKANDAINLKITVSGKGNISLLGSPKPELPESFEIYDPKINESLKTTGGVSGSKTFDFLIIPREKGEFTINNLNFVYFDPDKKEYVKLPSPDITITVLEGDGTSAQVIVPHKKGLQETQNDIRYIKTGDLKLEKSEDEFFSSTLHYILLIVPCLLFIGGLLLVKQQIKANSDMLAVKERKAAKIARKQLAAAEKLMQANQKDQFFNEVLNALHKYISDKLGLPVADLSKDKISEMLLQRNVSEQTRLHLIETLNTCEYAKYAPASVTGDLRKVYQDTAELILQMENQIRK